MNKMANRQYLYIANSVRTVTERKDLYKVLVLVEEPVLKFKFTIVNRTSVTRENMCFFY
jgi:hypothetical protein